MKLKHLVKKLGLFGIAAASIVSTYSCETEKPGGKDENIPEISVKPGNITDKSVEAVLEFKNSEKVACALVKNEDGSPDAKWIFDNGQSVTPDETTVSMSFAAEPETEYALYAASYKAGEFSKVSSIAVTTLPAVKMLSFIDSDKTSFTYKVEVEPNVTYRHCYIEGWYFEYALAQNMETEGEEFDMSVFLWNLLAEYGYDAEGTQEITWTAGDPDQMRDHIACLAPGKKYYALFSLYNETETWHGTPEAISFTMKPGGKSNSTVTPEIEACDPTGVRIRMNCDENVKFFFYQFYTKATADQYIAEKGEAGMMEHLFEYGWPAGNTYTEVWNTDPSTEYSLLIYGVDASGDEFLTTMDVTTPALEPSVNVTLKPYERELEGLHTYDTFEVTVETKNIPDINPETVFFYFDKKSTLDFTLEMMGWTIKDLETNPQFLLSLGGTMLPEEDANSLTSNGKFTRILPQLQPDTEYYYIILIQHNDKFILEIETAATDPEPSAGGESDPEYKAYLGEWTVLGQSTSDWTTLMEYTVRFEELTPNRSFKVYGWGKNEIAQEMPFVARYDPSTKKISIDTPQVLGKKVIDGKEYEIIFEGLFLGQDSQLYIHPENSGAAFTGKISQGHFAMFGEIFNLNGMSYEFKTMAYMGVLDGEFYALPGDEYNNVNFHISRKN